MIMKKCLKNINIFLILISFTILTNNRIIVPYQNYNNYHNFSPINLRETTPTNFPYQNNIYQYPFIRR